MKTTDKKEDKNVEKNTIMRHILLEETKLELSTN